MKTDASDFWTECYVGGRWISCEALLDKPLYDGMLKQRLIAKDQIPTVDWDGENNLEILTPWITSDRGLVASADDAVTAYQNNDEGTPPVWIERFLGRQCSFRTTCGSLSGFDARPQHEATGRPVTS
jgi:hypothetical protein